MRKAFQLVFLSQTLFLLTNLSGLALCSDNEPILALDFSKPLENQQWEPKNDISKIESDQQGLTIYVKGEDPYIVRKSPLNLAPDKPWNVRILLRSKDSGVAQLFFFETYPQESDSVRFFVQGSDKTTECWISLPPVGKKTRLRFDPPGQKGNVVSLYKIEFYSRLDFNLPSWPKPAAVIQTAPDLRLQANSLSLKHNQSRLGAFQLEYDNQLLATAYDHPMIVYIRNGQARVIDWNSAASFVKLYRVKGQAIADRRFNEALRLVSQLTDPDGGRWMIEQLFSPAGQDTIRVSSKLRCDRDRQALLAPLIYLFVGDEQSGTNKNQGLLAGLEYLENEPSSSTADVEGLAAIRRIPQGSKLTFPLIVLVTKGRYLAMSWILKPNSLYSPVFDSPDRIFHSGKHLMGLVMPPTTDANRPTGELVAQIPMLLPAGKTVEAEILLKAGKAHTVIPAVQWFVETHRLPPLPKPPYSKTEYLTLTARSWLESAIRSNGLFRHAYWQGFSPQPASDAAWISAYLSQELSSPELSAKLAELASEALRNVPQDRLLSSQIGHNANPTPFLVYSPDPLPELEAIRTEANNLLAQFGEDGLLHYRPTPGKPDFSKTHWANHANGLMATIVKRLLECAMLTGDRQLTHQALKAVQLLVKTYSNTVPRGAQTWEIPLHTPDLLASAYLVQCFTRAYLLTGNEEYLDQARYWGWTGVPFVYLNEPVEAPIGLYTTIPVYGATNWKAPVWFGLPVQWCGLVYAQALYELIEFDPNPIWKQLADGIVITGMQLSWPTSDRQRLGLLPDVFHLSAQLRDGPAINPATLFIPAMSFYGTKPFHRIRLPNSQTLIHAPGTIHIESFDNRSYLVSINPILINRPYWVLITFADAIKSISSVEGVIKMTSNAKPGQTSALFLQCSGHARFHLILSSLPQ